MRIRLSKGIPSAAECRQFQQFGAIAQDCKLAGTSGADLGLLRPQAGNIDSPTTNAPTVCLDLPAGGGVVCGHCHVICEMIADYLQYRREHKWLAYSNDPLSCFFAELSGSLATMSRVGFFGNLELLMRSVRRRRDYLTKVVASGVFQPGHFPGKRKMSKFRTLDSVAVALTKMESAISAAQSAAHAHNKFIGSLRQLECRMTDFVLYGDSSVISHQLLRDGIVPSSGLDSIVAGWLAECNAPYLATEMCWQAASLKRLLYMANRLAECVDTIAEVVGQPIVLERASLHECPWTRLHLACLDETISGIETSVFSTRSASPTDDLRSRAITTPTSPKSPKMPLDTLVTDTIVSLVHASDTLRHRTNEYVEVIQVSYLEIERRPVMEKLEALIKRTAALFSMFSTQLATLHKTANTETDIVLPPYVQDARA